MRLCREKWWAVMHTHKFGGQFVAIRSWRRPKVTEYEYTLHDRWHIVSGPFDKGEAVIEARRMNDSIIQGFQKMERLT